MFADLKGVQLLFYSNIDKKIIAIDEENMNGLCLTCSQMQLNLPQR